MPILFVFTKVFDEARMMALAQPVTDYLAAFLAIILFMTGCMKKFKKIEEASS